MRSDDTEIRVKTDPKHGPLYQDLRGQIALEFHEIFFICACLGYASSARVPLRPGAQERFFERTISQEEWACYYAIVLQDSNMDFARVQDDAAVIAVVEEYANGGIDVLVRDLLGDFVQETQGILHLDARGSGASELPKIVLADLLQRYQDRTHPR
jgi:hypothetical protein